MTTAPEQKMNESEVDLQALCDLHREFIARPLLAAKRAKELLKPQSEIKEGLIEYVLTTLCQTPGSLPSEEKIKESIDQTVNHYFCDKWSLQAVIYSAKQESRSKPEIDAYLAQIKKVANKIGFKHLIGLLPMVKKYCHRRCDIQNKLITAIVDAEEDLTYLMSDEREIKAIRSIYPTADDYTKAQLEMVIDEKLATAVTEALKKCELHEEKSFIYTFLFSINPLIVALDKYRQEAEEDIHKEAQRIYGK